MDRSQSQYRTINEGRRKKEEGRRKKEEGRGKKEEGRRLTIIAYCRFPIP
ncbi:MAG: hypothetical protein ACRCT1_08030 [Microcoleaceae cyanobacterium]